MKCRIADRSSLHRPFGLAALALAAAGPIDALAGNILLNPEEPVASSTYSGVANLRGWAVSDVGMDRIELYIDGAYVTDIPMGGYRQDVQGAFPSYPDSLYSGYSMAYNYGKLDDGPHAFTIRAVDKDGDHQEITVGLQVTGFSTGFIKPETPVNLDGATVTGSGNTLWINGMTVGGDPYDATTQWNSGARGMRLTQIDVGQGGSGGCTDIGWPDAGTKVTWQVSGYMKEYDANVSGTITTTYTELDTTHSHTQTTSSLSALGYTITSTGEEVQVYYIDGGMIYATYTAGALSLTVAGNTANTAAVIEFTPAKLLHPATHFCEGQTWTSPSVQQAIAYNVAGNTGTLTEMSAAENGAVESINTSVTVPAGTYTAVQYRTDNSVAGTSTRTWVDVVTGMDIKIQVIDSATGAVIRTEEATSLQ